MKVARWPPKGLGDAKDVTLGAATSFTASPTASLTALTQGWGRCRSLVPGGVAAGWGAAVPEEEEEVIRLLFGGCPAGGGVRRVAEDWKGSRRELGGRGRGHAGERWPGAGRRAGLWRQRR